MHAPRALWLRLRLGSSEMGQGRQGGAAYRICHWVHPSGGPARSASPVCTQQHMLKSLCKL
jgi:hypothetical protein